MEAKKKKVTSFDFRQFFTRDNLPLICLIILGVFAVVAILVSIFALAINPVIACVGQTS